VSIEYKDDEFLDAGPQPNLPTWQVTPQNAQ